MRLYLNNVSLEDVIIFDLCLHVLRSRFGVYVFASLIMCGFMQCLIYVQLSFRNIC